MKTRYKVVIGIFATLAVFVAALAATLSYTADCPSTEPLSPDVTGMKAITYQCYGSPDVLAYHSVAKPQPGADQVLVRVHAAAVNPLDWHFMRGSPFVMRLMSGIGAPNDPRLGRDFAGTVEAVGEDVSQFAPGDRVFGGANGAFSEYVVVREKGSIARVPDAVSFEQAAALPIAAVSALQALRDLGGLEAGQKVLINGASGGVGGYAVQLARNMGAIVHGVCSGRNVEMVQSLGAERVYNYKQEDYTRSEERYDLIVDMVGNHSPLANTRVLNPEGKLIMLGGGYGDWVGPFRSPVLAALTAPFVSQSMESLLARLEPADLAFLAELAAEGKLRARIDSRHALSQVPDAIARSETGRAQGKIIINVL